jgi:hypothetical protein
MQISLKVPVNTDVGGVVALDLIIHAIVGLNFVKMASVGSNV